MIRTIIKTIRKSINIFEFIDKERKELKIRKFLIMDFAIRWNSTYIMLKRFNTYKNLVNNLTSNAKIVPEIKKKQIEK
jgi:hypothetical protein